MHGGAKGSGAPKGMANGNYRHGGYTCETIQDRRTVQELLRDAKNMVARLVDASVSRVRVGET